VGNCFALRKDHETALKNFQRSVQLDSRFAYAHTLCGHEYVVALINILYVSIFMLQILYANLKLHPENSRSR
jgi:hypothetical protein